MIDSNYPEEFNSLLSLKSEIDQLSTIALQQKVFDTASKDSSLSIAASIKRLRKAIIQRRKERTDPLDELKKLYMRCEHTLTDGLDVGERHLNQQLVRYADEIAETQRQEQRRIQEEKQAIEAKRQAELKASAFFNDSLETQLKEQQKIDELAKQKRAEVTIQEREVKAQAVKGTREEWSFEIIDRSLVPDQYWIIDESALRIAVKNFKLREIPGIRIYPETKVSLRSY